MKSIFKRNKASSGSGNDEYASYSSDEKNLEDGQDGTKAAAATDAIITPEDEPEKLQRNLHARHISMIALGGALGTGLIIGGTSFSIGRLAFLRSV